MYSFKNLMISFGVTDFHRSQKKKKYYNRDSIPTVLNFTTTKKSIIQRRRHKVYRFWTLSH